MEGKNDRSVAVEKYREGSDVSASDDHDCEDDVDDENGVDGTTTETEPDSANRRDEVGEVRKLSSKDTHRLRLWRIVVTGVLLLTACAVTFTTYALLKEQEDENFHTAVRFTDWNVFGHFFSH
jgi:hypothetical protein